MDIFLDKKIYSSKAIKNTVKAYESAQVGKFNIKEEENFFKIEGKNLEKEDEIEIRDEFCNFLISEMKSYYSDNRE